MGAFAGGADDGQATAFLHNVTCRTSNKHDPRLGDVRGRSDCQAELLSPVTTEDDSILLRVYSQI